MKIQSNQLLLLKMNNNHQEKANITSPKFDDSITSYTDIPSLAFQGLFGLFKKKSQASHEIIVPEFRPLGEIEEFSKYNHCFNKQHPVVVAPGVYRGGRPKDEEGIIALKNLGVKKIISFDNRPRKDQISNWQDEKEVAEKNGIEFIHLPWDEKHPPSEEYISIFLDECKDSSEKPVYFHCSAGQDRAGTMGAIYDIDVQGMKFDEAYSRMLSQGHDFKAFPHLDAFIYNRCLDKGESPEDMHPREALDNLFYSNSWVRYVKDDYIKKAIVNGTVGIIKKTKEQ